MLSAAARDGVLRVPLEVLARHAVLEQEASNYFQKPTNREDRF